MDADHATKTNRRQVLLAGCVVLAIGGGALCVVARRDAATTPVEILSDAEQARVRDPFDRGAAEATNSVGMTLRLVPTGKFVMGSAHGYNDERPAHLVTLSQPFYLSVHEVTQAQFAKVMGTNPSHVRGPRRPVHEVTWHEAREFCRRLSLREGSVYRLPTEAEWEHACRAGGTTKYCFGDSSARLADYAWFARNNAEGPHAVGQRKPNAWGLHDMHGNVWEWCGDWFGPYSAEAQTDPAGPAGGLRRVIRGGPWAAPPDACRSAYRNRCSPHRSHYSIGFRVVRPMQ